MPSPSTSAATNKTAEQATTQTTAPAEQVTTIDTTTAAAATHEDVSAQISAAVSAENGRIMGILNCEEAKGRESQARALAETPGMTVESAQRILAAAPQSARRAPTPHWIVSWKKHQAHSAGSASSDAADDLLNTPV